jgi:signal transduction histidine kinase
METEIAWARHLAIARAALAALALVLSALLVAPAWPTVLAVQGVFVLAALAVLWRRIEPAGMIALLALFADTVFLLVVAAYGAEHLLWMASALYLFVLAEGMISHGPLEVAVVALVTAVFCGLMPLESLRLLLRTVVVAGALATGCSVARRRLIQANLRLRQKFDEAIAAAGRARDAEGQRIASDFHDGPLQSFISLQMRLEILRKVLAKNFTAGMQDLAQLQTLAQGQVNDLRAFLNTMRPVEVDSANLIATARRATEVFQKESGIPVVFTGSNGAVSLGQAASLELLQMLREALHNIQKHSGASRVAVALEKAPHWLEIAVEDNGHGFGFAGSYTLDELELLGLGPASLKRRARSLKADLVLNSKPGRGSVLRFRVALP